VVSLATNLVAVATTTEAVAVPAGLYDTAVVVVYVL